MPRATPPKTSASSMITMAALRSLVQKDKQRVDLATQGRTWQGSASTSSSASTTLSSSDPTRSRRLQAAAKSMPSLQHACPRPPGSTFFFFTIVLNCSRCSMTTTASAISTTLPFKQFTQPALARGSWAMARLLDDVRYRMLTQAADNRNWELSGMQHAVTMHDEAGEAAEGRTLRCCRSTRAQTPPKKPVEQWWLPSILSRLAQALPVV